MSLSKIKALTQTLTEMESMKASIYEDVDKDLDSKREEAFKAICKYMNDISEALQGTSMIVEVSTEDAQSLFEGNRYKTIHVGFNSKYYAGTSKWDKSKETSPWWIANVESGLNETYFGYKSSAKNYNHFIDADMPLTKEWGKGDDRYYDGVINLIECWSTLKDSIEYAVEKGLENKMQQACKDAESKITSLNLATEISERKDDV